MRRPCPAPIDSFPREKVKPPRETTRRQETHFFVPVENLNHNGSPINCPFRLQDHRTPKSAGKPQQHTSWPTTLPGKSTALHPGRTAPTCYRLQHAACRTRHLMLHLHGRQHATYSELRPKEMQAHMSRMGMLTTSNAIPPPDVRRRLRVGWRGGQRPSGEATSPRCKFCVRGGRRFRVTRACSRSGPCSRIGRRSNRVVRLCSRRSRLLVRVPRTWSRSSRLSVRVTRLSVRGTYACSRKGRLWVIPRPGGGPAR